MPISLTDIKDRWVQADGSLWALSELLHQEANGLGAKDLPGSVTARVKQLCDAHLRRSYATGHAGLRAHTAVLKTLEKEYRTDPVLLCWRVWGEDAARALASSDVRRPAILAGSNSHRAMAARWRALRRGKPEVGNVHREVFPKDWR